MKDNKIPKSLIILIWLSFIITLALIFYLSFQTIDSASYMQAGFFSKLARLYYGRDNFSELELRQVIYKYRQFGRIAIFFVLGVLGTTAIHVTFRRWLWIFRAALTLTGLVIVAIITERFKVYLPTRHYSETEMFYSIFSALAGFVLVSVMTFAYSFVKSILMSIVSIFKND